MPEGNCRPFHYQPAEVSEIHCAVFSHQISLKTASYFVRKSGRVPAIKASQLIQPTYYLNQQRKSQMCELQQNLILKSSHFCCLHSNPRRFAKDLNISNYSMGATPNLCFLLDIISTPKQNIHVQWICFHQATHLQLLLHLKTVCELTQHTLRAKKSSLCDLANREINGKSDS